MAITIRPARLPEEAGKVRRLFRAYQGSLSIDLGFQDFEAEVAALPAAYAPPAGRLLLAMLDGAAVGCIALRQQDGETGEIKRLYVMPAGRGHGLGRRLVAALVSEARAIGYQRLCLDTLPEMGHAQALYQQMGFAPVAPYTFNPVPGARYLGVTL
ncbi:MAG: GNAT family N-acetyltransferase [Hyphomicrobiaceae bacterium]